MTPGFCGPSVFATNEGQGLSDRYQASVIYYSSSIAIACPQGATDDVQNNKAIALHNPAAGGHLVYNSLIYINYAANTKGQTLTLYR